MGLVEASSMPKIETGPGGPPAQGLVPQHETRIKNEIFLQRQTFLLQKKWMSDVVFMWRNFLIEKTFTFFSFHCWTVPTVPGHVNVQWNFSIRISPFLLA